MLRSKRKAPTNGFASAGMVEWQTRQTQNLLSARMCGFKSHCRQTFLGLLAQVDTAPRRTRKGRTMESVRQWHEHSLASAAVTALKGNGFKALYAPSAEDAIAALKPFFTAGARVGFGGSMSVAALDIRALAAGANCTILDHNAPGLSSEAKLDTLRAQLSCDLFISSVNAVTLDGQLVNVDGTGNRVAALSFGPKATVVIAGLNKLVRDVDEAFERIELYAAPMNNKRLDRPNPCVKTGYCMDCELETRICRVYQILRKRPSLSDFTVILVGQDLGF